MNGDIEYKTHVCSLLCALSTCLFICLLAVLTDDAILFLITGSMIGGLLTVEVFYMVLMGVCAFE